jgi:hypothetical protein
MGHVKSETKRMVHILALAPVFSSDSYAIAAESEQKTAESKFILPVI